jgi:hypothetical protein
MLFGAMWVAQSCRKNPIETKTVVFGQVLEQGMNKPIPNAQIIVSHCEGSFGSTGGVSCSQIDTFFTDSKGAYRYEPIYVEKNDYGYTLSASAKGYLKQVGPASIFPNQLRKEDIVLVPEGYIKFHIKNVSKSDWMQLLDWGQANDNVFDGKYIDTTMLQRTSANTQVVFNWKVVNNITTIRFKDSIFLPALDTVFYRIEY